MRNYVIIYKVTGEEFIIPYQSDITNRTVLLNNAQIFLNDLMKQQRIIDYKFVNVIDVTK